VSWNGEVYADQFWRHFSFGNVRNRPFSEIWTDVSGDTEASELMKRLKDKRPYVKGRCAECKWLQICGGNFRVRAEAATGDLWNPDPACYLTDEEIGISEIADMADRAEGEVAVDEGVPVGGETD
jgi:radical SAM protein with 4Fe4S-binding SPASM domain